MPRVERTDKKRLNQTDLLSCAFCGCLDVEGGPFPNNRDNTEWCINCGDPSCNVQMFAPTREEVVERWNRNRTGAMRTKAWGW
jgi:hypothetical protein